MTDISCLGGEYRVKRLGEAELEQIFRLYSGNREYFRYCPPAPSREGVLADMNLCPEGLSRDEKLYMGFFDGAELAAVLDMLTNYPEPGCVYIGLFMVEVSRQGAGVGRKIIDGCFEALGRMGFHRVRLAYARGNDPAERFWRGRGFAPVNIEKEMDGYTAVVMEKPLI